MELSVEGCCEMTASSLAAFGNEHHGSGCEEEEALWARWGRLDGAACGAAIQVAVRFYSARMKAGMWMWGCWESWLGVFEGREVKPSAREDNGIILLLICRVMLESFWRGCYYSSWVSTNDAKLSFYWGKLLKKIIFFLVFKHADTFKFNINGQTN